MLEVWLERIIIVLAFLLVITFLVGPVEPDQCALCDGIEYHAPCLLNIKTGQITEIGIYEPHDVLAGELAPVQHGGYFGISMSNGLTITKYPDEQVARTTIPAEKANMKKALFCRDCRKLLKSSKENYILVDMYDPESPAVFEIADGFFCEMRCYSVSASYIENGMTIAVTVTGNYLD